MVAPEDILLFWFSESRKPVWFGHDLVSDQEIAKLYGETYEQAKEGALEKWEEDPNSTLALVLVLSQFPRKMFRDTPRAYESVEKAIAVAERAIAKGFDRQMGKLEQSFLYMPFMYSEKPEHQQRSVALFEILGVEGSLNYAKKRKDQIDRFGRFPHRNAILKRDTSPEEEVCIREEEKLV